MRQFLMMIMALVFMVAPALAAEKNCKAGDKVASVDGMVCDFCTQSITKALKKNPEVKDVTVDLTAKTVTVSAVDGKEVTDEMVSKAIDYAGYKMTDLKEACKG